MSSPKDLSNHPSLHVNLQVQVHETIHRLKSGAVVSDDAFDQIYPKSIQKLSRTHWTPVSVAELAARWLIRSPKDSVVDIGSGVGKFCLLGALTTEGAYVGIELDPSLANLSRNLAKIYQIPRVKFVCQDIDTFDWTPFQGAYLYNPFSQRIKVSPKKVGAEGVDFDQFTQYVSIINAKLLSQPAGFRVATYCGFGGERPPSYDLIAVERFGPGYLEVWEKSRARTP